MATIERFEDIKAWQKARDVVKTVYRLSTPTTKLGKDFGLRDQIRRASVSVMSNIAEGFESSTDVQFINFLGMARASAGEVRSPLYIALDQDYISKDIFETIFELSDKTASKIGAFIKYLKTRNEERRTRNEKQ